jgi:hypothetical protein
MRAVDLRGCGLVHQARRCEAVARVDEAERRWRSGAGVKRALVSFTVRPIVAVGKPVVRGNSARRRRRPDLPLEFAAWPRPCSLEGSLAVLAAADAF